MTELKSTSKSNGNGNNIFDSNIVFIDLGTICRCCLQEKTIMHDIYQEKLDEKLKQCTNLNPKIEDSLPSIICENCFVELELAYTFSEKCKNSDIRLRKGLGLKINEKDTEASYFSIELKNDQLKEFAKYIRENDCLFSKKIDEEYIENRQEINKNITSDQSLNEVKEIDPRMKNNINDTSNDKTINSSDNLDQSSENSIDYSFIELIENEENLIKLPKNQEERKLSCHHCDAKFKVRSTFNRHIKNKHPEHAHEVIMTSYHCEICNKTFKFKFESEVNVHKLTHSNIKPYKCPDFGCNKTFQHKRLLNKHVRNKIYNEKLKQNPIKKKSYLENRRIRIKRLKQMNINSNLYKSQIKKLNNIICEYCGKMFPSLNYKFHVKNHTASDKDKFSCELCDKKYVRRADLINHQKTHSEERPYACDLCNKTFILKSRLREHGQTHVIGERLPCFCCNKTFKSMKNLKNHYRNMSRPSFSSKIKSS